MNGRITFKKGPLYSGQMRLAETYHVNRDGVEIAIIQKKRDNDDGWFWYGDGVNTCGCCTTLEECKQSVKEHFEPKNAPGQTGGCQ